MAARSALCLYRQSRQYTCLKTNKPEFTLSIAAMKTSETFISVISAVHNAEPYIEGYLQELSAVLKDHFAYYEILLVDNGSTDGTRARIRKLQQQVRNIRLFVLPRHVSQETALVAGIDNSIGDFVATLDAAADPPGLVVEMMHTVGEGAEIVYALPRERVAGKGAYHRLTRYFLKILGRIANLDIPPAMSSCRLFSRAVLNFILEAADRHLTLPVAQAMSGYPYCTIEYDRRYRPGSAGNGSIDRAAIVKAINLLFASSLRPLRFVTLLSLSFSLVTLLYAVLVVVITLVKADVASGWPSMSLQISGLFFLVFVILAVMSEYLLRTTETVSHRPLYVISQTSESSVMEYVRDLNVNPARLEPAAPLPAAPGAPAPVPATPAADSTAASADKAAPERTA